MIPPRLSDGEVSSGKLLLTEREVSARLGISPRALFDLRKSGRLAYIPFGKSGVRYLPEQIEAWIASVRTDRKDAD